MTTFAVTRPDLQLQNLRSGHPLDEPDAMPILQLDLTFLNRVARHMDNLGRPNGDHKTAWVSGHRGYRKTQSMHVLSQMFAATAAKQGARILLVHLSGKDIGITPVEELILKYYFTSTASPDDPRAGHYRSILRRVQQREAELKARGLYAVGLGLDILGSLLNVPLATKNVKYGLEKAWRPPKMVLHRRLRGALETKEDDRGARIHSDAEVDFLMHWFDYLLAQTPRNLSDFQTYYQGLTESLRRTVLFSLIKQAGIATIVLMIDEADDFGLGVSPPRTSFEVHYDSSNDEAGLNFYYLFFCVPDTVQTLRDNDLKWGFTRRYLGPTRNQEMVLNLDGPDISPATVSRHLGALATLYALSGSANVDVAPQDAQEVVRILAEASPDGHLSWHGYWTELIDYMDSQAPQR